MAAVALITAVLASVLVLRVNWPSSIAPFEQSPSEFRAAVRLDTNV
jgi:hypothetical protein